MKFNYDKKADALSIRFSEKRYVESDQIQENVILDYDKNGKIIGIEILDASKILPPEFSASRLPQNLSFSVKDFAVV